MRKVNEKRNVLSNENFKVNCNLKLTQAGLHTKTHKRLVNSTQILTFFMTVDLTLKSVDDDPTNFWPWVSSNRTFAFFPFTKWVNALQTEFLALETRSYFYRKNSLISSVTQSAAGPEAQAPWGSVYEWRRKQKKRLMHGLVNQTQFCVIFIALWWRNGSFQTPQSCQVSHRSLFRPSPMVVNHGNHWKSAKYKQQTWDFFQEFTRWHFATKCTAVKSVKSWMSMSVSE